MGWFRHVCSVQNENDEKVCFYGNTWSVCSQTLSWNPYFDNIGINQSMPNFDNTAFYTDWVTVSVFMNLVASANFYVVFFSYTCTTMVTVYRDLSTVKMHVTFKALLCRHWHPALMCVNSTYAASLSLLITAASSYCFPIIAYQVCAIVIINSCMPTEMTCMFHNGLWLFAMWRGRCMLRLIFLSLAVFFFDLCQTEQPW